MILDYLLEFADATSVGAPNNTTVNVGDVADLGTVVRDIGNGEPLYLVIQVTTAITSGGAATVRFKLVSDSTATPAVDGSASEHYVSNDFAVASLVAGFGITVAIPMEEPDFERYLGVQVQETAGQALTAGNINAFLTKDVAKWKSYADATN